MNGKLPHQYSFALQIPHHFGTTFKMTLFIITLPNMFKYVQITIISIEDLSKDQLGSVALLLPPSNSPG
jgi:hypothetical protein